MSIDPSRARGPGRTDRTRTRHPARAVLLMAALALATRGSAQEAPSKPSAAPAAASASRPPSPGATTPDASGPPSPSEIAALRAEVADQLQAIAPTTASPAAPPRPGATPAAPGDPAPAPESAANKSLRELFQERLRLLGEYDKASSALKKAINPEPSPEGQADEARADLARFQAQLSQAATSSDVLLPQAFRPAGAGPSVNAEMKAAIEAATAALKERKARLEALRTEATGWEEHKNARRAERDRLFQEVVAMKARAAERAEPAAGAVAAPSASQRLARERQANAAWKARVAAMQLQAIEAQIALETRLAAVRDLGIQAAQAGVRVAERTLELMQACYSAAAERQERLLKERAAVEESRASHSDDPMERYRARRHADLLDLEALVVKHEQALATSPPPSLEEQQALADRAANDFARVKTLLDDGRVSRLDAIRLNNDFRRIGPERDRLLRNEQAPAEVHLQYYEDALTGVELELLSDSLQDHYELELLKERLAPSRWAECERLLADLERTHRDLLVRRRKVLEQLADVTSRTLDQITRRLAILDEEYAFIRTHLFWVRDREPIGAATLTQGARECQHLLKALVRLAQESARPRNWGRPSAEFVAAIIAALGLPIGLVRLRRLLRARLAADLAAGERGVP